MKKIFCLVFLMLTLVGCATTVKFDPVTNRNVRTLGLSVSAPSGANVVESTALTQVKQQQGLLGLLIFAAAEAVLPIARKEAEGILSKEISESGFNFQRQLTEELEKSLRNVGYDVVVESTNEKTKVNSDGFLSVVISNAGYQFTHSIGEGDYVCPFVIQQVRLTSKAISKEKEDKILYASGSYAPVPNPTAISERYCFDIAKPENKVIIIKGLQALILSIAEGIAADLMK